MKLAFSFVGMKPQTLVWRGQELLNVVMEEDTYALDQVDVIYTGYQWIDPRRRTSAISSVNAADVLVPGMTSIDQALEGRIPELQLTLNSGEVGATPRYPCPRYFFIDWKPGTAVGIGRFYFA